MQDVWRDVGRIREEESESIVLMFVDVAFRDVKLPQHPGEGLQNDRELLLQL